MLETYTIEITFGYFILLVLIMNVIGFAAMALDKSFASQEVRRISEKTLLIIAFFCGALGAFVGMKVFRHKTQKVKFYIGLPILILFNIVIIYLKYKITIII